MNVRKIVIILLLIASTGIVFGRVGAHDFIDYDDPVYVIENEHVLDGLGIDDIAWAFTTGRASNWHPLTWLSHCLEVELFGPDPGAMHIVNVVLHMLGAVILFLALEKMTGAIWISALVAGLFALHPTRVESVAWISERKDVLSGVFWMLTIWTYTAYVRRGKAWRYVLMASCFALGLLAKPMLVTLPCVLLLLDWWPLNRWAGRKQESSTEPDQNGQRRHSNRRLVLEKVPLLAMSFICCLLTLRAQQGAMASVDEFSGAARLGNAAISFVRYLGLMFSPNELAVLYPYPRMTDGRVWSGGQILGAVVLLLLVTALVFRLRTSHRFLIVGWLWFLGTLVPVIGVVQVGVQSIADRYTYLPLIGGFIMLAWTVREASRVRAWLKFLLQMMSIAILVLCGIGAWKQVGYWKDSETLFLRTLDVTTDNWMIHNNLGVSYGKSENHRGAAFHFTRVMEIRPDDELAQRNLIYSVQRMREQGETELADLYSAIARALELAREEPGNPDWLFNLGIYFARLDEPERAIANFKEALKENPRDIEAHLRIGAVHQKSGDPTDALEWYRRALRIDSESLSALNTIAWVLATHPRDDVRDGSESIRLAERARIMTENLNPLILLILAAAYAESTRFDDAKTMAQKALDLARQHENTTLVERAQRALASFEAHEPLRDAVPIWN